MLRLLVVPREVAGFLVSGRGTDSLVVVFFFTEVSGCFEGVHLLTLLVGWSSVQSRDEGSTL